MIRWPRNDITWALTRPNPYLPREPVLNVFRWCWGRWAAVCGIQPSEADDPAGADIRIEFREFGDAALVGMSEFPEPTLGIQRTLSLSSRHRWSLEIGPVVPDKHLSLARVFGHELGHGAIGLPDGPQGTIMGEYFPLVLEPTTWDIAEAVRRYGAK